MYEESVAVGIDRIFRDIREIDYCLDVWSDESNKSLYDTVKYDLIKYIFLIAQDDEKASAFVKLYLKCNTVEEFKNNIDNNFTSSIYCLKEYIKFSHKQEGVIKRMNEILDIICMMYIVKMEYGISDSDKIKERSKKLMEEISTTLVH